MFANRTAERAWTLTGTEAAALRHGIAPLLFRCDYAFPTQVRESFGLVYRRNLARNMYFLEETRASLEILHRARIDAMPLKGVLFAARRYPDIGCRPQSDVDLLVRREDLEKAHRVLLDSGWSQPVPAAFYEDHYHWVYLRHTCLLELHWALKPSGTSSPSIDRVWRRAREIESEGIRHLNIAPEDELAYLAVNKGKQRFGMLIDFVDVHMAASDGSLDWDRLVADAETDRTAGALWYALSYSSTLLGTPIPAFVLERLRRHESCRGARCLRRLIDASGGPLSASQWYANGPMGRIFEMFLEGGIAPAWRLCRPLLFPSRGRLEALGRGSYGTYVVHQMRRAGVQIRGGFS